jgi:hypothetical protein
VSCTVIHVVSVLAGKCEHVQSVGHVKLKEAVLTYQHMKFQGCDLLCDNKHVSWGAFDLVEQLAKRIRLGGRI